MKWFLILLTVLVLGCPITPEVPVAETADIAVIDGEDAGTTPWEFYSIIEEGGCTFSWQSAAALHGVGGYQFLGDGVSDHAFGTFTFAEKVELYARYYIYIPAALATAASQYAFNLAFWDGGVEFARGGFRADAGGANAWYFSVLAEGSEQPVTNFSVDTLHYIDIYYYVNGVADGEYRAWVDGTLAYERTGFNGSAYRPDRIKVGQTNMIFGFVAGNGDFFYLDDILLSTTGPIGEYNLGVIPREPGQGIRPPFWHDYQ